VGGVIIFETSHDTLWAKDYARCGIPACMVAVEAFGGGLANATACGAADRRRARNRVRCGREIDSLRRRRTGIAGGQTSRMEKGASRAALLALELVFLAATSLAARVQEAVADQPFRRRLALSAPRAATGRDSRTLP